MPGERVYADFEAYVGEQWDVLLRMARRLVPDPTEAQDLMQVALTKAFLNWDRISGTDRPNSYLYRIMVNTRHDWWRARRVEEIPRASLPDGVVEDFTDRYVEDALLHEQLSELPSRRRDIVVLRYLECRSTRETAQALGMATGTVKSGLRQGLSELRGKLSAVQ